MTVSEIKLSIRLLILPCLLLMAQSLAFAHEFDHPAAEEGNPCVICPLGSNVEAAATDSGSALSPELAPVAVFFLCEHVRAGSRTIGPDARAPPYPL
ncbi:MAG: hypothetical protein KJO33_09515 [Gammaproteobacteria bacterium]|nr:hypothetical protein [Gammaproteobacteria bacterium]